MPTHYVVAYIGLEACGCLERVDVRGNALASLGRPAGGPGPLAALTALTALDAGANRLTAFPAAGDLPPALLAHLSLDRNRRAAVLARRPRTPHQRIKTCKLEDACFVGCTDGTHKLPAC